MSDIKAAIDENAIAIIGMACRFPLGADVKSYWKNLCAGVEAIRFFTDDELMQAGVSRGTLKSQHYVKAAALIEGIENFDADFFDFTPREAEILDPQQRILLECAYHALEQSGYATRNKSGDIGVFLGTAASSYAYYNLSTRTDIIEAMGLMAVSIANDKDFAATQLAYRLNLTGPAVNVNTACSTSLVAVHQAVNALLNFECDMALAGGATIRAQQVQGYHYLEGNILSPDGHCRPFSSAAAGTIDGNGAGIIVLKRLNDALADGDRIDAVIKGSAVNNDGSDKLAITAPSVKGQARVVREALAVAGIEPEQIGYVEAHGTGTPLGDPVEVAALNEAFIRRRGQIKSRCALGSVKSNMGHLDTAAGIAGLIKAVLAVKHGRIPPTLHFSEANAEINFSDGPFYVAASLQEWPVSNGKRYAGVSSFGIGGTNAHIIIEQPPAHIIERTDSDQAHLLLLSAKSRESLLLSIQNLDTYLRNESANCGDIAYTLSQRPDYPYHFALAAQNAEDAIAQLSTAMNFTFAEPSSNTPKLLWLFDDHLVSQGIQELCRKEPVFNKTFRRCAEIVQQKYAIALDTQQLEKNTRGHALLVFSMQYALASLYQSLQLRIDYSGGYGVGRYVAAHFAGVLSFEQALAGAAGQLTDNNAISESVCILFDIRSRTLLAHTKAAESSASWLKAQISEHLCLGIGARIEGIYTTGSTQLDWLRSLAELYMLGATLSMEERYSKSAHQTLALPGYAFYKKRYWIEPATSPPINNSASAEVVSEPMQAHLWHYIWQSQIVTRVSSTTAVRKIIFADAGHFSKSIFADYPIADAVWVLPGERYHAENNRRYYCNPLDANDYKCLLDALSQDNLHFDHIECFLILESSGHADLLTAQQTIFNVIKSARQYKSHEGRTPLLRFYTRHAYQISGDEPLSPVARALTSMLTVINQEIPNAKLQIIDIDTRVDLLFFQDTIRMLDAQTSNSEILYALRGRKLWKREYGISQPALSQDVPLNHEANIVLTGGLGMAGLSAAKNLAMQCKHLILIGRRNQAELDAGLVRQLNRLQAINSRVEYLCVDVSKQADFIAAMETIQQRLGKIDLLIHAAGQMHRENMQAFESFTQEEMLLQHKAKVDGVLNIAAVAEKIEIKNIVLMSSLSASLGGLGMAAYAAANGFMDAFAESQVCTKTNWYSIDWDGLGEDAAAGLINAQEMLRVIKYLLEQQRPGLWLYAQGDLNRRWHRSIQKVPISETDDTAAAQANGYINDADIEVALSKIYEQLIGVSPVSRDDNFFEIGGDSLSATQLCMLIEQKFFVDISIEAIFDKPEVSKLAEHIKQSRSDEPRLNAQLAELVGEIENMDEEQLERLLTEQSA